MSLNVSDVITAEAVLEQFYEQSEENLVWREAFRNLDATGIDSDTLQVPKLGQTTGKAEAIPGGAEYPREEESREKVSISHEKYGKEAVIEDEAVQDAQMDVIRIETEDKLRDLAEGIDAQAYDTLASAISDASAGDDSGNLTYTEVVNAKGELMSNQFMPDILYVGGDSYADLLTDDKFIDSVSESGDDEVVRQGLVGRMAGMDVMLANDGNLAAGEAILVDSEYFGYESTREEPMSRQYEEPQTDSWVVKVRTRKGWTSMDTSAGLYLKG